MHQKQRFFAWRRRLLICFFILACLILIWCAYVFGWSGSGFQQKTLWDWLQLLLIPLFLTGAALYVSQANTTAERKIAQERYEQDQIITQERYKQDQHLALDKQREDLFQSYLDTMSELLLERNLRSSKVDAEVRKVARVRTISILMQLNSRRIEYVFAFLREAGLTDPSDTIISFRHANLRSVSWKKVRLFEANLSGAKLSHADLSQAYLYKANLSDVNLSGSDLRGADLRNANLSRANLSEAILSGANFSGANLSGATLKNVSIEKDQLSPQQIADAIF